MKTQVMDETEELLKLLNLDEFARTYIDAKEWSRRRAIQEISRIKKATNIV